MLRQVRCYNDLRGQTLRYAFGQNFVIFRDPNSFTDRVFCVEHESHEIAAQPSLRADLISWPQEQSPALLCQCAPGNHKISQVHPHPEHLSPKSCRNSWLLRQHVIARGGPQRAICSAELGVWTILSNEPRISRRTKSRSKKATSA